MIVTITLSPAVDKIYFVEDFQAGKLYRTKSIVKSAGGKGINVARVATALGEKVTACGFQAGEAEQWLVKEVQSQGIDTSFIEVTGETRTNNNIIDIKNGTETEVLECGPF